MRILLTFSIALAAAAPAAAASRSPEERLARELEGRTAGTPVSCITQRDIRSARVFDRTAIVYEMNGGTYYLNRPPSGAAFLNSSDVLVTDTHSDRLCSVDIVRTFDTISRISGGTIGLGQFVPYTKPGRAK